MRQRVIGHDIGRALDAALGLDAELLHRLDRSQRLGSPPALRCGECASTRVLALLLRLTRPDACNAGFAARTVERRTETARQLKLVRKH
jgi:hypothetical protein